MSIDGSLNGQSNARGVISARWLQPVFTATLLFSACLLFIVQPLFARMSLPLLGGTPSVWAVAMCFFQAILLAGYGYAHALRKFLGPLQSLAIHTLVLFAAFSLLPFSAPVSASPINGQAAGITLAWLYFKAIGIPFFALSATAPLLQSWFGRTKHRHAASPYFLYAASNIGSIGALFAYPLLIEPFLSLNQQVQLWTFLFAVLIVAITMCGHLHMRHLAPAVAAEASAAEAEPITAGRRFYWVVMAFVPSALLVAWTNYLTGDIASAPFLWLPPLVMFLLTFVLEFRDRPVIPARLLTLAQALAVPATLLFQYGVPPGFTVLALAVSMLSFFASALICHRQLYNSRPSAANLTEFYVMMSVGGVLGGLFVSIVSPIVFSANIEYPLLLVAALVLRQKMQAAEDRIELPFNPIFWLKIIGLAVIVYALLQTALPHLVRNPLEVAVLAMMPLGFLIARKWLPALACLVALPMLLNIGRTHEIVTVRNYFGVLGVQDSADGNLRWLRHGTTFHGAQLLSETRPDFDGVPYASAYYSPTGGMARALLAKQDLMALAGRKPAVGIVGLGSGAFSCYRRNGEAWTFFEIDPDVIRIARNPAYFTYLSKCGQTMRFVEGDARLMIQQEADGAFDFLLIDAFSSDSIPTHLLTVEAIQTYLRRMKPNGVLVIHLSNRFMDLPPFVAATATAADAGLGNRLIVDLSADASKGATPSSVMVLSRDAAALDVLDRELGRKTIVDHTLVKPWTDDFTNATAAILRNLTHGASGAAE
jgi:SAM-dependent methyltransferase